MQILQSQWFKCQLNLNPRHLIMAEPSSSQRWVKFSNMGTLFLPVRIFLLSPLLEIAQLPFIFQSMHVFLLNPIQYCPIHQRLMLNPHALSLTQFSFPWLATKLWLISVLWLCAMGSSYLPLVNGNKKIINPPRYQHLCEKVYCS